MFWPDPLQSAGNYLSKERVRKKYEGPRIVYIRDHARKLEKMLSHVKNPKNPAIRTLLENLMVNNPTSLSLASVIMQLNLLTQERVNADAYSGLQVRIKRGLSQEILSHEDWEKYKNMQIEASNNKLYGPHIGLLGRNVLEAHQEIKQK